MIVRPRLNWWRMLFVLRGSVLVDIAPQLLGMTGFAILVTVLHGQIFTWKIPLNFVPFSLIGLTLAIFLGFRNSTSYARFWEARVLWGNAMNDARNLTRHALTLLDTPGQARELVVLLIAFVHLLRHQLRGTDPRADVERLLGPEQQRAVTGARFKPAMALLLAGQWLRERRLAGQIAAPLQQVMEEGLNRLTDVLGGCERIATTPIPFTYAVIIHRTIYAYCVLLPFGLVDSIGPTTPVVVAVLAYTFLALEALGAELEDPFGTRANDLALDAISITIEATLCEMLGEPAPPLLQPGDDYLVT